MTDDAHETESEPVELKDPLVAAGLALVLPGLGHLYQGRTFKGLLFAFCILGMFMYGWNLGGNKVVYARWNPKNERRWAYLCQMWVGLPAWPAMVQSTFDHPLGNSLMVPPESRRVADKQATLSEWSYGLASDYELGTVFTMVAGLLNVLAIFDAAAGTCAAEFEEKSCCRKEKRSGLNHLVMTLRFQY